jgi:hypothetical protein
MMHEAVRKSFESNLKTGECEATTMSLDGDKEQQMNDSVCLQ